ncbi:MAG: hypothetical protein P4L50_04695 [Anaerolineaceae bacterium]|nr:hypothetical protein [Anaerolineaceae bacterium]
MRERIFIGTRPCAPAISQDQEICERQDYPTAGNVGRLANHFATLEVHQKEAALSGRPYCAAQKDAAGSPRANLPVPLTSNLTAELNLRWSTASPVKRLQPREFDAAVAQLTETCQPLMSIDPLPVRSQEDVDMRDFQEPKRTQQQRWNDRLESTRLMLEDPPRIEKNDKHLRFAYFVDDTAVGIMKMSSGTPPYIDVLLTHPLSEGVGSSLVEQAVASSAKMGSNGELELCSLDKDSSKAYEAMGFFKVTNSFNRWRLNPNESENWVIQDGQLIFRKNVDAKYIT